MENLRAIKIIHDRKNRVLYNIVAEFFRFIGVFVLEDTLGYLSADSKTDDTQFVIYLTGDEIDTSPIPNEKPYYTIIVNKEKLNNGNISGLTLEKNVLVKAQADLNNLLMTILKKIQISGIIVPVNTITNLLKVYLDCNVVIAASNLQYYRIVSDMHKESRAIFLNAVQGLESLRVNNFFQDMIAAENGEEEKIRAEFHYYYSLLYCKYKVNLACWFWKNGEYNYRSGDGVLCDSNGFRREVELVYKVFDLVEECKERIAAYPQDPNLYVLLGLITERASDGYLISVEAYTRALQTIGKQPYASHVYYWLGWIHERNGGNLSEEKRAYANAYLVQKKYRNIYKVAVMYEQEKSWPRFFEYMGKCKSELERLCNGNIRLDPLEIEYYCKVCLLLCIRSWQYLNDADAAIQYGEELLMFYNTHIAGDALTEFKSFYGNAYKNYQEESKNRISLRRIYETLTEAYREKGDMEKSEFYRMQY